MNTPAEQTADSGLQRPALAVIRDPKLARAVQCVFASAGMALELVQIGLRTRDLAGLAPREVLLYDVQDVGQWEQELDDLHALIDRSPGVRVVYLMTRPDRELIYRMLSRPYSANILSLYDTDDLFVSLRKAATQDIFGVQKYLAWGALPTVRRLRRSAQKRELVVEVREFVATLRGDGRLVNLVGGVADELLMNALYNAPYDQDGAYRFRHLERSESVELAAHEEIEFCYASDGRYLAVGCQDPFGSLSPNLVQERLAACFEETKADLSDSSGGAGLGLFMIYNKVGKLVVNLQPGACTEFIGIFDLRASSRERKSRTRGLNIFVRRD